MSAKSNKKNAKRAPQQVLTRRVFPTKPAEEKTVSLMADGTRPHDAQPSHDRQAQLEEDRLSQVHHVPGKESGAHVDVTTIAGPKGKTAMHQTESTVDHPMGKTHHGVRQSHER